MLKEGGRTGEIAKHTYPTITRTLQQMSVLYAFSQYSTGSLAESSSELTVGAARHDAAKGARTYFKQCSLCGADVNGCPILFLTNRLAILQRRTNSNVIHFDASSIKSLKLLRRGATCKHMHVS